LADVWAGLGVDFAPSVAHVAGLHALGVYLCGELVTVGISAVENVSYYKFNSRPRSIYAG
jgi:hypothetical protein